MKLVMPFQFCSSEAERIRASASFQVTRTRPPNVRVLIEPHDSPDAEQILARAKERETHVNHSTTHRTVGKLVAIGVLNTHTFDEALVRFQTDGRPFHGHLKIVDKGGVKAFVLRENDRPTRLVASDDQ
ncbi:MAG: transcriptional repressor [Pseudomonadota bacterium]